MARRRARRTETRGANVLAGASFDRCTERRKDPEWLLAALRSGVARVVPLWRDEHLATRADEPRAVFVSGAAARALIERDEDAIFLGEFEGMPCFALELHPSREPTEILIEDVTFQSLRALATRLPRDEANLLAYARGLLLWHRTHRYCAQCGTPTQPREGGHVRACTNPECGAQQFPRLDPAVIVLVSRDDRCLLGRQPNWPAGVYSTIAGFVEAGESLEDAVRREVAEETGVRVGRIAYHSSQPWPFPSSLMIGFTGEADTEEIRLTDSELEDARWFTREEIAERVKGGTRVLPSELSIAFRLVCDWFDEGESGTLVALVDGARRP
jgi:NAD+ diphosphatase